MTRHIPNAAFTLSGCNAAAPVGGPAARAGAASPQPLNVVWLLLLVLLPACTPRTGGSGVTPWLAAGRFDQAAERLERQVPDRVADRDYVLAHARLGVTHLAAGHTDEALAAFEPAYELLRTQGVNADRTVASVLIHENVRVWKGEPFEQALTYTYYGMAQAQSGSWDNARAAFGNALFQLRDFGTDERGRRLDTEAIAARAYEAERRQRPGRPQRSAEDYLDHGYTPEASDFTLAYLLHGIASQQLGRPEEASDYFRQAQRLQPQLTPVIQTLRAGDYNTVLVVSAGMGPRKLAYGPSRSLTRFAPMSLSSGQPLIVDVDGKPWGRYPVASDLNPMSRDHRWNNLEQVRAAKATIGQLLTLGGAIVAYEGIRSRNTDTALVGAGILAGGLLLQAGAGADTRYLDVLPQRWHVVPLNLSMDTRSVTVRAADRPDRPMVLTDLTVPRAGEAQLFYVRLPVAAAREPVRLAERAGPWSRPVLAQTAAPGRGAVATSGGGGSSANGTSNGPHRPDRLLIERD